MEDRVPRDVHAVPSVRQHARGLSSATLPPSGVIARNLLNYLAAIEQDFILVLVDMGIRAEELCNLTKADLNLSVNSLMVRGKGAGKDKAERVVHFGKIPVKALWKSIAPGLGNPEKRL